ncbi:hypothetical protein [Methanonatronarchaeum sp. AMET-Sl]|uniref:hypothetical protein n=1 Tax=Methanonatronarchaeum sp. AMET-Sl TaxID=3037654 RepID=UPI00244E07E5|nr:hypothetical protein [Methanonatronarchaeum sp. AMET-Sl]WGI17868.1 hypothetical protein QEN48_02360 [Methanonatronarchaeum sp. AMET-Sl]
MSRLTGFNLGVKQFVRDGFFGLVLVFVLVLGFLFFGFEWFGVEYQIAYFVFLVGLVVGYLPIREAVDYLYSSERVPLLVLEAEASGIAVYELSREKFQSIEVEGELTNYRCGTGDLYLARKYNPESNRAVGVWMGYLDDLELMRSKEAITELRTTLTEEAQKGLTQRVRIRSIIQKSLNKILGQIIQDIEQETIFKGEQIEKTINEVFQETKQNYKTKTKQDREEIKPEKKEERSLEGKKGNKELGNVGQG